jgi:hypothetical protein
MDYVKLVETINAELEANGINTIYTLITNNVSISTIEDLMINNTKEYSKLTDKEKKSFQTYLKTLRSQCKLLSIF